MRILSENGSKLQDIYFGDVTTLRYFDPTIYLLGNKCYLAFEDSWGGDDDIMLVYSIDRNTSSIQQVAKHKGPGVSPTIADRSESICVTLEEGGAREVQVVNAGGKTVLRVPVKAGQHEVNIPARRLSRGVNVVYVIGSSNSPTKVIVK